MIKSKLMRIVIVAPTFPLESRTFNGGTQGASYYLCAALRDLGAVDLEIIRPMAPTSAPRVFTLDNMRVHTLARPWWQPLQLYVLGGLQREVKGMVGKLAPDLVHVQADTSIAAALRQVPVVLTIHGIIERDALFNGKTRLAKLKSKFFALTYGRARRRVRNIIAISPYTHNFINGSSIQKVWDIPNPVADDFFEVKRAPVPGRVFSASHLTPLKNVVGLIQAFGEMARHIPHAELRLAGSHQNSAYGAECRQLAKELGVGERVKFLGLLTAQELRRELSTAACFALCSLQENAPLSIAEAMAAGVPVLGSNICGIPWMVDHEVTGRLVQPADTDAISQSLFRMLREDDLSAMGRAGKEKALRNYRASMVAAKTLDVYRDVLGQLKEPRLE